MVTLKRPLISIGISEFCTVGSSLAEKQSPHQPTRTLWTQCRRPWAWAQSIIIICGVKKGNESTFKALNNSKWHAKSIFMEKSVHGGFWIFLNKKKAFFKLAACLDLNLSFLKYLCLIFQWEDTQGGLWLSYIEYIKIVPEATYIFTMYAKGESLSDQQCVKYF